MSGIKRREDTYIMFHDKFIEKVDISTCPTSFRHLVFPLNKISLRGQGKPQHLIEMTCEMFYFVTDLNSRASLRKMYHSSQHRLLRIDQLIFPTFSYLKYIIADRRDTIQTRKQQYIRKDLHANVFFDLGLLLPCSNQIFPDNFGRERSSTFIHLLLRSF